VTGVPIESLSSAVLLKYRSSRPCLIVIAIVLHVLQYLLGIFGGYPQQDLRTRWRLTS
jgi:hypothetical protein